MQITPIILFGLVIIAFASTWSPDRMKPTWSRHLSGWQKLFGMVAFVAAILIIINPEFLALGLLGDTAFFDLLVFAISLQLQSFVARALRNCATELPKAVQWMKIPSPGMRYLLAVSALTIGNAASAFQKAVHRFLS